MVSALLSSGDPQKALQQLMSQLVADSDPFGGDPFGSRNEAIPLPKPPRTPTVVTVKVSLDGARPPIWRRLELRGDLTLDRVHEYLQAAMGWYDCHLHRFEPGPVKDRWRAPYFLTEYDLDEGETGTPEADVRLDQVLRARGDRLFYTYDFGDDWAHTVTAEAVRAATDDDPPARAVKAMRTSPPEDVGGIHTWNELAAALRDDPDPTALTDHLADYADWLPEGIDPDTVDLDDVNARLDMVDVVDMVDMVDAVDMDGQIPDRLRAHPWVAALIRKAPDDVAVELADLLERATAPVATAPPQADLQVLLRPWQTVLDVAGPDGIPLTKAGWMAPAACERLWHESGVAWEIGKGNREQHTPELQLMRDHATAARLIRKTKDRLVLTPLGRRAAADPQVLIEALVATLTSAKDQFDQDAQAVTLLLIASGVEPPPPEKPSGLGIDRPVWRLQAMVARLLTDVGWRENDGPIPEYRIGGARIVVQVLSPQLGNARGGAGPTSPAAQYLARRALTPA